MSILDYQKARKAARKSYQNHLLQTEIPTLPVLDDILPPRTELKEVSLGLVQIPIDRIVGTRTNGRSNAFAGDFMPILAENSEFARKWIALSDAHLEEGIREPIKAYEYMNKFYVEEGNKRVSVLKYFGAVSIPGNVIRIIPPHTGEKENQIYFEFLRFYEDSQVNYIWFSQLGSFAKLQNTIGLPPGTAWSEEDRLRFSSVFSRFELLFNSVSEKNTSIKSLGVTTGDAFLFFISLYDYDGVDEMTMDDLKQKIVASVDEYSLLGEDKEAQVRLQMDPPSEKTTMTTLLSQLTQPGRSPLKIAFINDRTPASSAWTYSHELGRLYLEQKFPGKIVTTSYPNVKPSIVDEVIDAALEEGNDLVFTTSSLFEQGSLKAALSHPGAKILNCSLNSAHHSLRTYYARMYEAKFMMGAIAGALSENDRLAYVADNTYTGVLAEINAFALGASMINPRVKVHLLWNVPGREIAGSTDVRQAIRAISPDYIMGRDMLCPDDSSREFGLYSIQTDDYGHESIHSVATPLWNWGKFYEKMIHSVLSGTWKNDEASAGQATSYFWGMSSGIIDIAWTRRLHQRTQRLVRLLRETISGQNFNPFSGVIYSQTGTIIGDPHGGLTPEQIMSINWLAENIIGQIPSECFEGSNSPVPPGEEK